MGDRPTTPAVRSLTARSDLVLQLPDDPPQLTPAAARALLDLLLSVHSEKPEPAQPELPWDRTG